MESNKVALTQLRLHEVLRYDPLCGLFNWVKRTSNRINVGDVAGNISAGGYVQVYVDGRNHLAHRLAFLYMKGYFPKEVDHRDCDRTNNKWTNLRDVSRAVNLQNLRRAKTNNKLGVLGVSNVDGRFKARVQRDGKIVFQGIFSTLQEASDAYLAAKRRHHDGCTL